MVKSKYIHLMIYMMLFMSVSKYLRAFRNIANPTQTDTSVLIMSLVVLFIGSILIILDFAKDVELLEEDAN